MLKFVEDVEDVEDVRGRERVKWRGCLGYVERVKCGGGGASAASERA
jgi:hypothetical protein